MKRYNVMKSYKFKGGNGMVLRYCPCCGAKLIRISTKTALYKAVCVDCEMTFKLKEEEPGRETIRISSSSPSQMTEAAMSKN